MEIVVEHIENARTIVKTNFNIKDEEVSRIEKITITTHKGTLFIEYKQGFEEEESD